MHLATTSPISNSLCIALLTSMASGGDPCVPCDRDDLVEPEPCGEELNALCGGIPNFWEAACGQTWCGTAWTSDGTRDTDWYLLEVGDGFLIATLTASFDGVVFIIPGECDAPVAIAEGTSNDCVPGVAQAEVTAGTYRIFVATASFDGVPCDSGMNDYRLEIACTPPLAGDACEDAIDLRVDTVNYSTEGTITDGQAHASCQWDGQTYHDLWFDYVPKIDGELVATTCGMADYDTDLVIYEGCDAADCPPGDDRLLDCNDDDPNCPGFTSTVSTIVAAGHCYRIRVGGWNDGDMGIGTLSITVAPPGCITDLDDDGVTGSSDLAILLAGWGTDDPTLDFDGSGLVDAADLSMLLSSWGFCPP